MSRNTSAVFTSGFVLVIFATFVQVNIFKNWFYTYACIQQGVLIVTKTPQNALHVINIPFLALWDSEAKLLRIATYYKRYLIIEE